MRADRKIRPFEHDIQLRAVSPRQVWLRQAQQFPRSTRLLFITIVVLCTTASFMKGMHDLHDQAIKSLPTDFPSHLSQDKLWAPVHPIRHDNGTHIDDRYTYLRHLGRGKEGSVDLFFDEVGGETVVVKQISTAARNLIPASLLDGFIEWTDTWPTEIEAGLLLGDKDEGRPYPRILDYFILQCPSGWSWAMVSPFVSDGTLLSLARAERNQEDRDVHELDREYRHVFEDLLEGVASLHSKGLCHNDIKPDNVFIRNSTSWLLGDLGNVRHFQHPWHFTSTWKSQNQWQDCQLNDVRRLLKSYLAFLRAACSYKDLFDDQFWYRHTPWSVMFWDFDANPVGAERVAELSRNIYKPKELSKTPEEDYSNKMRGDRIALATEKELLCTTIPSRWWFVARPV